MRLVVALAALLTIGACTKSVSGTFEPVRSTQPPAVDALVIVDASRSLSPLQRSVLTATALDFVMQGLPVSSTFQVHLLHPDMGIGQALIRGEVPKKITVIQKGDAVQIRDKWKQELSTQLQNESSDDKAPAMRTSCYVKSAAFARSYFTNRRSGKKSQLIWIGDMLEDCPLPDYQRFTFQPNVLSRLGTIGDLGEALKGIEVRAVLMERQSDSNQHINSDAIKKYWLTLAPKLGAGTDMFLIGSPNEFDIKPSGEGLSR